MRKRNFTNIYNNFIIYISNFLLPQKPYRVFWNWLPDYLITPKQKTQKSTRLHDFLHSSLCFRKSTSRLYFLEKYIPKYLTFGFQFCIFALLNVHHKIKITILCHPERNVVQRRISEAYTWMSTRFFGQSPQQLVFTTLHSVLNDNLFLTLKT